MKSVVVNLLPSRQSWYLRKQRIWQTLQQMSVAVAVVYMVLLGGLFSWRAVTAGQIKAAENQLDEAKQQLDGLSGVESQQVLIKSKLSRLQTEVLKNRVDFSEWLEQLVTLLPAGVVLKDVKVDAGKKVAITGGTSDVQALSEFIGRIQDPQVGGSFLDQVTIENLSKSSTGEYVFDLQLLPKVGTTQPVTTVSGQRQ